MPTIREPLAPIESTFECSGGDEAWVATLHEGVLSILERTGVRFRSDAALDLFAQAGAPVDRHARVVRMPRGFVLDALAQAPRSLTLAAREQQLSIELKRGRTYCTTDGCGTEVIDRLTGERRRSAKADVADATRMQDYLGSLGFWWPTVGASDHGETAQLHELEVGWNNTAKHLMGMVQGGRLAEYAVEMAKAAANGAAELRRRPLMSSLIGTVSPLVIDEDGYEAAMVFARAGVPVCFVSMPTLGTTAPASRAGAYALGAAEVLGATVALQLAYPGTPVIGSVMQVYADPRSGGTVTRPRDSRWKSGPTSLLHSFGLPVLAGGGGTDALTAGSWQAAMETALGLFSALLDPPELISGIGLLRTYRLFTPQNLLLDDDIYHNVRLALTELSPDDAASVLDVIDAVGPGGHFLGAKHTRTGARASFTRGLAHQLGDDGRYRDALLVAKERAETILSEHHPTPLSYAVAAQIREIVAAADAEAKHSTGGVAG